MGFLAVWLQAIHHSSKKFDDTIEYRLNRDGPKIISMCDAIVTRNETVTRPVRPEHHSIRLTHLIG